MPWSDDMRCLHCDGKLPLYRKLTSGQFCSAAHRKAYWEEQERLAVERLHQTHDSLAAYRASLPEEPVVHVSSLSEPLLSEPLYVPPAAHMQESEVGIEQARLARTAANRGTVKVAGFLKEASPEPHAGEWIRPADVDFAPWSDGGPRIPSCETIALGSILTTTGSVAMARFGPLDQLSLTRIRIGKGDPVLFARGLPRIPFTAAVATPEFEQVLTVIPAAPLEPEQPEYPFSHSMFALPRLAVRGVRFALRVEAAAEWPNRNVECQGLSRIYRLAVGLPLALRQLPWVPVVRTRTAEFPIHAAATEPSDFAIMAEVPRITTATALAPALRLGPGSRAAAPNKGSGRAANALQPVDVRQDVTGSPFMMCGTQARELELRFAPGCRYQVSPAKAETATAVRAIPAQPEELPRKQEIVAFPAALAACEFPLRMREMFPLTFAMRPRTAAAAQPVASGVINEYPENPPLHPVMTLRPVDGGTSSNVRPNRFAVWAQAVTISGEGANVLTNVADFWKNAPRDLKMLVVAIPLLLGLALRPSLPKVRVSAPASSSQIPSSLRHGFQAQWMNVRRTVASRAGVALNEEFRSGLDDWQSKGGVATAWSFDSTGFVRPGSLALYRPSMGLTNYELQFLGLIDKKALSWVVRAADFDNYYVVKLVVVKAGPMPTMGITRYAVINGKAQNRVDTVASINARPDTLYRVSLNVNNDTYLLTLQGIVVDSWTEDRLKNGGIGFFAPRGEESRVRWVQVTHQYDMLGRLCAFLAPYNISTTNGSW